MSLAPFPGMQLVNPLFEPSFLVMLEQYLYDDRAFLR